MSEFLLDPSEWQNGKTKPRRKAKPKTATDPFDWKDWASSNYPVMQSHSMVKTGILRDYIEQYVEILCRGVRHGSDSFRLTFVDGFSGGGIYKDGQQGSPFVIMNAVRVAEARVNEMGRKVRIKVDAHYYFVDAEKSHIECLSHQILNSDYRAEIDKSIFLVEGDFQQKYGDVVAAAKKRYRDGGRVIFFLDQCGYSQVKPTTIRAINKALNCKAEFIINIAIQWFNDHLRDGDEFKQIFAKMELGGEAELKKLVDLKNSRQADWRYLIESELGPMFWKASGCEHWSPFYIRPEKSHRGYWLVHLSPKPAARYAMASVQWKNGNSFLHYGRPGLRMLAYEPNNGKEGYFDGWAFNEQTRQQSAAKLVPELLEQVWAHYKDGIPVSELIRLNCNDSIADHDLFCQAIGTAASENEIVLKGPKLGDKRSGSVFQDDIIIPSSQKIFPGFLK